jgi:alpha-L-fucosidase
MAEGGEEERFALRRVRTSGGELHLVPGRAQIGQDRAAGRRAYDGANSNYWDLYHFPAEPGDTGWYSKNPRWQQQWFNEIKELVDNYKPDLLYSDGGVPFGNEVGLSQIANLYNVSRPAHRGKSQAVYTCKQPSGGRWVQDYERGVNGGISPYPWQTDTSIGDWFYNKTGNTSR